MANAGMLPGDLVVVRTIAPELVMEQPVAETLGFQQDTGAPAYTTNNARNISISPDGSQIVVVQYGSTPYVRVFPGDGSTSFQIPTGTGAAQAAVRVAFHPSGSEFAVSLLTTPFYVRIDSATLAALPPFSVLPPTGTHALSYSPDGRYLAFAYNATNNPCYIVYDLIAGAAVTGLPALAGPTASIEFVTNTHLLIQQRIAGTSPQVLDMGTKAFLSILPALPTIGNTGYQLQTKRSPDLSRFALCLGASPYIAIISASTWQVQLTGPFPSMENTPIVSLDWIGNDVLSIFQTSARTYDLSGASPVFLGMGTLAPANNNVMAAVPGGGKFHFAGIVNDGATTFLERKIGAVDRATGRNLGETTSLPDGSFSLSVFSPRPAILYCVGENGETTQLADDVTPVPA